MSIQTIRDAFNEVASPSHTCSRATLSYVRAHDIEWQVLEFSGTSVNGPAFVVKSDMVRPGGNVEEAARVTARALLSRDIAQ